MSNPELLKQVTHLMLDDPKFAEEFEEFAKKHCSVFEDADENKLEYTSIYNTFTDLFQQRVEALITKAGSTTEAFVAACAKADEDAFIVSVMLSITSFDEFKKMMLYEKGKLKQ